MSGKRQEIHSRSRLSVLPVSSTPLGRLCFWVSQISRCGRRLKRRPQPLNTARSQRPAARAGACSAVPRRKRRGAETHSRGLTREALRPRLVIGHRRWLPEGWEASPGKIREAASEGISLEPGQTWMRGHTRSGHTAMSTISVSWKLPAVLAPLLAATNRLDEGQAGAAKRRH